MMKPENPSWTANMTSTVRSSSMACFVAGQMSVERGGEQHPGQRTVVLTELERRFADAGIGLADTPEILPDGVHVVRLDPQPQPRREVHARDAARRTVGPAETGKVRVPLPPGESLDVGRVADRSGRANRSRRLRARSWHWIPLVVVERNRSRRGAAVPGGHRNVQPRRPTGKSLGTRGCQGGFRQVGPMMGDEGLEPPTSRM